MTDDRPGDTMAGTNEPSRPAPSLVVCSLEPWTEVRRRLRILVDEMVARDPGLRVLYVAPPVDPLHQLRTDPGHLAHTWRTTGTEQVHPQLRVLRPRKWAPRAAGPFAQRSLERQVLREVTAWGLRRPVLWVNDAAYAPLLLRTGWPAVYDITDDWLLSSLPRRQRVRLETDEKTLMDQADAIVVCSADLARSRGEIRPVELIGNGVDVARFRTPEPRPTSLPPAPTAVYVGTLHEERFDVDLVVRLATERPDLQIVLVGPDSLAAPVSARLRARDNVRLIGPVPYEGVPAFLQHADVVIVPHRVNAFTESLDPIKAYECMAVGRPTVATPVAGFRGLGRPVRTADGGEFVAAVSDALSEGLPAGTLGPPAGVVPSWQDRAQAVAAVVQRVREGANRPGEVPA
jgi:glycosyltransferase involved in cell wall biosynthesis